MRQRTGSPFTRSTSRSTRARSNATSPNGRADERVPLSPRHHGARALGRCDHRAGSDDRRRGHSAPRGAAARDRKRRHPPDHPDPPPAAHRAPPGPVHPGGERHLACARRVGTAGIHRRRARACSPGVHRRRTHRLVRIHVRGRLGTDRAHPPHRSDGSPTRLMDSPSDAGRLTPRERGWLIGIGLLYAAVVIPIGIHKGGDFTQELTQSERLLRGIPLYVENPRSGIWWPPFTALGLVPFALVARWSLALATAGWALLNVACLGWSLVLARRWTPGWMRVELGLAAGGKPVQGNFSDLNFTRLSLRLILPL